MDHQVNPSMLIQHPFFLILSGNNNTSILDVLKHSANEALQNISQLLIMADDSFNIMRGGGEGGGVRLVTF